MISSFLQLIIHIVCSSSETDRRTKKVSSKNRYLEATYCLRDMGRLKKYCFCFRPSSAAIRLISIFSTTRSYKRKMIRTLNAHSSSSIYEGGSSILRTIASTSTAKTTATYIFPLSDTKSLYKSPAIRFPPFSVSKQHMIPEMTAPYTPVQSERSVRISLS